MVHFMLDEAAALGRMDSLTELVDKYRAYSCRATFVYQSQGQLAKCWPEDQGMTLMSNASAIYFGTADFGTAQAVSQRLGNHTIAVESGGGSSGASYSSPDGGPTMSNVGTSGRNWGENYGWSQIARPLLTPDEVLRLPQRTAITFIPGMAPVVTTLVRYYEETFHVGLIRRTLSAFKVLLLSLIVFALSAALCVGLSSVERPVQEPVQPKHAPNIFGEIGG